MSHCSVLIISQRNRPDGFGRQPGYVAFTEAEDILASSCEADMLMIERNPNHFRVRARRVVGRTLRKTAGSNRVLPVTRSLGRSTPITEQPPRDRYDLAVFIGFTMWDLPLLEHVKDWVDRADRLAVWFPEAWASDFDDSRLRHDPFVLADVMFVGMKPAMASLKAVAPGPVHFLPPAVDSLRFGDIAPDGPRPIDILGIGRRDPALHARLVDWSQKNEKFYVYDTISGSQVPDVVAHRVNLGDTYRRTNLALTHYAKYNLPEITKGRREIPGRFWEALASGTIMAGYCPNTDDQIELTGRVIVHDLPSEPNLALDLLADLANRDNTAERAEQMALALRKHDWAHRWDDLFLHMGIQSPIGLRNRIEKLATKANLLDG